MPEKSLNQLLQEYATSPEADSHTRNRASFLRYRDEIFSALTAGWSMRKVWRVLHDDGRISFSYSVFAQYVKKYR